MHRSKILQIHRVKQNENKKKQEDIQENILENSELNELSDENKVLTINNNVFQTVEKPKLTTSLGNKKKLLIL